MKSDVCLLVLGACEGAYALAASFAGELGVPVTLMDEQITASLAASALLSPSRVPGLTLDGIFLRALSDFYAAHAASRCMLIPAKDIYAEMTEKHAEYLSRMFLLPHTLRLPDTPPPQRPEGLLLVYGGREEETVRTVYGRTVVCAEDGSPISLVTEDVPARLLSALPPHARGLSLFAVKDGALFPYAERGALAPQIALSEAMDASVAEWILYDWLLCEEPPDVKEGGHALFTLYPYGWLRRSVREEEKKTVGRLRARRLVFTLFSRRYEKFPLRGYFGIRRFAREAMERRAARKE